MSDLMNDALELRRKGKIHESNELLLSLINENPNSATLHFECARGLDSLGSIDEAIPHYEKAISLGLSKEELEDAFVGLGICYRIQGRHQDAKDLFKKAIQTFPNKEQMKVFYAMALYHVKEYKEAMEYLIQVLAWTTSEFDILKNYRAITYLGYRLDADRDKIITLATDSQKSEKPSGKSVVEKVMKGLKGRLDIGDFFMARSSEYDDYYLYFNDEDYDTRRCALAEFTVMLGNWSTRSSFAFTPQRERKFTGQFYPERPWHELNNYIESFVAHQQQIEQEFPVMNEYIIRFLIEIEKERNVPYEIQFPEVDQQLFKRLREEILIPNEWVLHKHTPVEYFLKEAGISSTFQ